MAEIRFKRASLARWVDLNPILGPGEPGYVLPVIDDPSFKPSPYHSLKVGDGVTRWNDLPYVDECRVQIYKTESELPVIGTEGVLYLILLDRSIKTFYIDPSRLDENEYTGEYISFMGGSDDSNP